MTETGHMILPGMTDGPGWWWLSYADEERCLGVVIVHAPDFHWAMHRAKPHVSKLSNYQILGAKPLCEDINHVASLVFEEYSGRLLPPEEAHTCEARVEAVMNAAGYRMVEDVN